MLEAIALYDSSKKALIGVFSSQTMAAKYLFKTIGNSEGSGKIAYHLHKKSLIVKNDLNLKVAVRIPNKDQMEFLNENIYYISPGYPILNISRLKGWTDTRVTMAKYVSEKANIIVRENSRKLLNSKN
jgi:hypothetical protein